MWQEWSIEKKLGDTYRVLLAVEDLLRLSSLDGLALADMILQEYSLVKADTRWVGCGSRKTRRNCVDICNTAASGRGPLGQLTCA
jgi:hypothetical protein